MAGFEKWQALGNDYVIVEREAFGVPLVPAVVRRLCDVHTGLGADGVLELSPPDEPGHVARLRIFNPDGSEAELSGNGAREAVLYLRARGWTSQDEFSIQTLAGEVRPQLLSPTSARVAMGRASVGEPGELGGRSYAHVRIGNPQTAFRVGSEEELEGLDLPAVGGPVERDPRFPGRTNVSFYAELAPERIRARIFERGVGETASSGTGACGAAIAHVLRGSAPDDGRVTVVLDGGELEVEVDEALSVHLTGWAVPVYAGALSRHLLQELQELASDVA